MKKLVRVYVAKPKGLRIAGLGSRATGDYFEVTEEVAKSLLASPDFTKDPGTPTSVAKPRKPKAGTKPREVPKEGVVEENSDAT